ncbi:MAG TPA: HD domain-containing phosphohydrolase, partial [Anaerolineales bacterium]
RRLDEAEETLRAIRNGEVDALIVSGVDGEQVFSLKGVDHSYRVLIEDMNEGALTLTAEGMIMYANRRFAEMLKTPLEKVIGSMIHTWVAPSDKMLSQALLRQDKPQASSRAEVRLLASDGTLVPVYLSINVLEKEERQGLLCMVLTDLTEQKRLAQKVIAAANQSRLALLSVIEDQKQTEEALQKEKGRAQQYLDIAGVLLVVLAADQKVILINKKGCEILGYVEQEIVGRSWFDFLPQDEKDRVGGAFDQIMAGEIEPMEYFENPVLTKSGQERLVAWHNSVFTDEAGRIIGVVSSGEDITERKRAEKRIQLQLEHLTALSTIDRFIASVFDIKLNLTEILTHVTKELGIDAADVLILNSNLQMLEYGAERGFRAKTARKAQVRLSESYAGRAALERQLVQIPNLSDEPDNSFLTNLLTGEDFVCYFGVPLIAKGQVNGVLEVFHRATFEPDAEWFDFLYALAGRAVIAIENSTLFESMQRSNSELILAYNATIEGWSHALDLRDKETEGHTQRVAEMTMKLGRAFGLSEAELAQVRWGALLHDIGKMGVPDGILLKPGPLTDEEWVAMKKHPTFAYEMLSPIRYLRLALDIPYCHHEKWDGSGYPRGLKGEQIPLVARIFAVVDVWDALKSDRPYRQKWSKEKAIEHIRSGSGTHFDPKVVDVFMQISE